jgi:hypothetical protein
MGPCARSCRCVSSRPMSDVSQGPGWWLASDGKWYPPEQAPPPPPPPPPPTGAAAAPAKPALPAGGPKDYLRVCDGCGTGWLLPKEWAKEKPPKGFQVRSMQRATRFAIGRQRERYSMQAATLQGSQDRVLNNARCPSCGSTTYTQYKPGETPPP